ncbi:MAG: DUF3179 domain-containing protein [Bacteroidota bacterium]
MAYKGSFKLNNLTISSSDIYAGGPKKDGIPSIDDPIFIKADLTSYLNDKEFVLGVYINGIAKAYPINILNYHEIVNDQFGEDAIAITYCPLCNSGIVFNTSINGQTLQFGVSGLLYQSDVLLYDRSSESLWSQILGQAISGKYSGTSLEVIPSKIVTWGDWKKEHPETLLLSDQTKYIRNYNIDPYLDYYSSEKVLFPVELKRKKFNNKEKVLVIEFDEHVKIYPFKELKKLNKPIIEDAIDEVAF